MIQFWEIYLLDDEGEPIEHTQETHKELTFSSEEDLVEKARELIDGGHKIQMWHMGFDPTEGMA